MKRGFSRLILRFNLTESALEFGGSTGLTTGKCYFLCIFAKCELPYSLVYPLDRECLLVRSGKRWICVSNM